MLYEERAIFLDRDGTLNVDTGYVHRQEDWHWLPGVPQALARFRTQGWRLLVVTNQSGIARGYFDATAMHTLHQWVDARLAPLGARLDGWYHCPHLPEISGPCGCRKPKPGLLWQAAADWGVDMAASWMIGDKPRDVMAGHAAGCRSILLRKGSASDSDGGCPLPPGVLILPDLPAACDYILAQDRGTE
ncbi:MAG: D-glycero-beta-D-manno-heptose 1,7-bisphosphate 7-phosphatase [Desulfovibrio sp.]|nr:D-glycero-beta-D-manno-heptose 1,7-bisphosphate 7-phosphatase [Desulfovibrio sp.]